MKKLTKFDILSIKPGKSQVFVFDTAKAVVSARQYVWQIGHIEPPSGIKRYTTKANYQNKTLYVEAIPTGTTGTEEEI